MKIYTYCGILLMGALLVSIGFSRPAGQSPVISASNPASDNSAVESFEADSKNGASSTAPSSYDHTASSGLSVSSPEPSQAPEENTSTLKIKDTPFALGEGIASILKKFGKPGRIVDTEYDFDYYVFNNDYKNLFFLAVKDGLVTGFYTDSLSFRYMGITPDSDLDEVNRLLNSSYHMSEVISIHDESVTAKLLMDAAGTGKATGIYVLSNKVKEDGFTDSVQRSIDLLTYDLTNSIRARNAIPVLSWSSSAAKAARKHSLDMAANHYFNHISPDGERPGDRLNEEGLNYQSIGENIIAGYGTAILCTHAWFNSTGHRENLLNPDYKCIGIGFTYQEDSSYKTYMTQEFYR